MSRRWLVGLGIVVAALVVIGGPLWMSANDTTAPERRIPPSDAASESSARFLDRYVEPDGRVVRRDQGNDTVSEGQAYAMLIAVATGDRARFDSVWNWAITNLRQPSGLLAWRWQDGAIVDPQPATDADLDAARALAVASVAFNDQRYAEEARVLAKAIADNAMAYPAHGRPILLAGPWANQAPFYVNPSYHSPRAEQVLAVLTTDTRWPAVLEQERRHVDALIGAGEEEGRLPPDWAIVDLQGPIRPAGPPADRDARPQYSYDAVRLPIRLAESCDAVDREQAARMWQLLNRSQESRVSAQIDLDGDVRNGTPTAVGAVAAAAGAHAAGDSEQSLQLLDLADDIDLENSTYYGSAWTALGRIMLTTTWLGDCSAP